MFVLQLHKCIQPKLQLPSDSKIELHSVHSGVVVLLCQERRVREMPEELSSIKIDLDLISSFPPQFCAQPVCRERLRGRYLTALTRRGRQVVLEMSTVYRDFPLYQKGNTYVNNVQNLVNVVCERPLSALQVRESITIQYQNVQNL